MPSLRALPTFEIRLVSWTRTHTNEVLDWLLSRAGPSNLVFKLFPGHIADQSELRRLFARTDITFMVVRRPAIDCYISGLKVRATGQWLNADTTNVSVKGDVSQFLAAWGRARQWYHTCRQLIQGAGRPHVDLSYKGEISQSDEVLVRVLDEKLRFLGIDPGHFIPGRGRALQKQDHSSGYEAKMANWREFSSELRARADYFAALLE
jgi:hypothetical protein